MASEYLLRDNCCIYGRSEAAAHCFEELKLRYLVRPGLDLATSAHFPCSPGLGRRANTEHVAESSQLRVPGILIGRHDCGACWRMEKTGASGQSTST